ncbi:branched-chain amino acid ABC transporter [Clostridium novyi A str. 4552]|uniref:Branched-chain amino acid transport system carrier protein n=1 Tax=Clostridium novyi A str. 4552 TaxID=1444289 RepID=A0A0A0I5P6_CLONO|nr:branched-chain amino acid transport system II carrier protein [Clostridium novyi]KGM95005.1 branched-chain amino acid ABC transporter [Clostridium novyi A str. 4552]
MNKRIKDYLVIGFALFAMFFGAGNLIFPPALGRETGSGFLISIIGFLITGVGLPLIGILSCIKSGGNFELMANKVGKKFSIITTTALILAIGPMVAIPRTAATTFELSFHPLFPSVKPFIIILIYFIVTLAFVLNPSSIVDNIGKFLTPILMLMLSLIIVKGIISPMGPITNTNFNNLFPGSLLQGYQTMDAMAAVIFASIIITSVKNKGYTSSNSILKTTVYSSIVAVIGLSFIYGGLLYLGSQTTTLFGQDITKTQLITEIAKNILGSFGTITLSISVGLACLTTSIGLTATASEFFTRLSNGKLPYKFNAIAISIISMILALNGVDKIVAFASPVLDILYPVIIVIILLNLLGNIVKNNNIISITVYVTLLFSVLSTINSINPNIYFIKNLFNLIPLSNLGFMWVIPTLITFIVLYLTLNNKAYSNDNFGDKLFEESGI